MAAWKRTFVGAGVLLGCWCTGAPLAAQGSGGAGASPFLVTDAMLLAGHSGNPEQWPMYGGDYHNNRYSPLDQINTTNVKNLRPAWIFQTGIAESFETTPVVVGGEMYITTPAAQQVQKVIKLNARTGEKIWESAIRLGTTIFCCGPNNRGVAVWQDKVYLGTLDARLVALDARTGRIVWEQQTADPSLGYSQTHAPVVFDGKVIIGSSGGEYGIRGFVKAYDANTGRPLWTWYTIPSPEEGGWWGTWVTTAPGTTHSLNRNIRQEKADSAKYADAWQRGGGGVWMTPAVDPERRAIYVSVGNPSPDLDGSIRPGDNRWTDSVCSIHVDTGRMNWCYQYIPHDVWDLDAASPPFLFDFRQGNRTIPAVGHFSKLGFLYVLDRNTGRLLKLSKNYVPHENLFALPTPEGTRMLPGANGGTEWSPGGFSPQTGYAYSVNLHQPMHYSVHSVPWEKGRLWLGSAFTAIPGEDQWGNVVAVDPVSGNVVWEARTEEPMMGGVLVTAGGLVFAGQPTGSFDAWDARTGQHLWSFRTGAGCNAAPMTYQLDGKQYVAVACGGIHQIDAPRGDALIVFALP